MTDIAHVAAIVRERKTTLERVIDLMDCNDDDTGVRQMRAEIDTCAWVLELITR